MNPFYIILKKLTHATAFLGTFFIVAHTHIVGPIPCCKVELFMRKNEATFAEHESILKKLVLIERYLLKTLLDSISYT